MGGIGRVAHASVLQPFNLRAAALFFATGIGLYFYFQSEKEKVQQKKRMHVPQACQ